MKSWYTLGLTSLRNAAKEDSQLNLRSLALAISEGKIQFYAPLPEDEPVKLYCVDSDGNYVSIEGDIWEAVGSNCGTEVFAVDELSSRHIADRLILEVATDGQFKALEASLPVKWIGLIDKERAEILAGTQKLSTPSWPQETKFSREMLSYMNEREKFPAVAKGTLIVDRDWLYTTIGDLMIKAADLRNFSPTIRNRDETNKNPLEPIPGYGSAMASHWGEGLRTIINLANRMWGPDRVDPNDEDTFPVNTDVIAEFEGKGFNNRIAKDLAKAIRPDWGKVKSRKKSTQE